MGTKKSETLGTGLRTENGIIVIDFRWEGKRYRPATDLRPTKQGIQAAAKIRQQVVNEINVGLFDKKRFIEYFPESKQALEFELEIKRETDPLPTFADVARDALELAKRSTKENTLGRYKSALNTWWMPYLAELPIDEIDEDLIETTDASLNWKTDKTRNNSLIPLRMVFKRAMKMRRLVDGVRKPIITHDPTECLSNSKVQKKDPDPFTANERDAILSELYRNIKTHPIWYHYFVTAFYTGMRTGELMGLSWDQIDFNSKTILVDRVVSDGELRMSTKTDKTRTVPMLPIVFDALTQMKQYTFLQGAHVFALQDQLDTRLCWPKPISQQFQKVLRKLGIRQRPAYNTRHTFATTMLMDNAKPGAAAKILGHSLYVFFSTYATWLDGDELNSEIQKLQVTNPAEIIKNEPNRQMVSK